MAALRARAPEVLVRFQAPRPKDGVGYGAWTHIDGWSESVINYIQGLEGFQERED